MYYDLAWFWMYAANIEVDGVGHTHLLEGLPSESVV